MRFKQFVTTLALLSTMQAVRLDGQGRDQGLVSWGIYVHEAVPVRAEYRSFVERQSLQVALYVHNESARRVSVAQDQLREAVSLELVVGSSKVDALVRWQPDLRLSYATPNKPIATDLMSPVILEPKSTVTWTLTVERADGVAFVAGKYGIGHKTTGFAKAVRTDTGDPWGGRAPDGTGVLVLFVTRPSGPSETSLMHLTTARDALRRQASTEALAEFELAVGAERNVPALRGLAEIYFASERYTDSARVFEEILQRSPTGDGVAPISDSLARAHVGAGDEQSAARVLRTAGVSEDRIVSTLNQMRADLQTTRER
jgi:hypothetical protein